MHQFLACYDTAVPLDHIHKHLEGFWSQFELLTTAAQITRSQIEGKTVKRVLPLLATSGKRFCAVHTTSLYARCSLYGACSYAAMGRRYLGIRAFHDSLISGDFQLVASTANECARSQF